MDSIHNHRRARESRTYKRHLTDEHNTNPSRLVDESDTRQCKLVNESNTSQRHLAGETDGRQPHLVGESESIQHHLVGESESLQHHLADESATPPRLNVSVLAAPLDCSICLDRYNSVEKRPRILHCGHTLCTECIQNALEQNKLMCPLCRAIHLLPTSSAQDLTVNFLALSLIDSPHLALTVPVRDRRLVSQSPGRRKYHAPPAPSLSGSAPTLRVHSAGTTAGIIQRRSQRPHSASFPSHPVDHSSDASCGKYQAPPPPPPVASSGATGKDHTHHIKDYKSPSVASFPAANHDFPPVFVEAHKESAHKLHQRLTQYQASVPEGAALPRRYEKHVHPKKWSSSHHLAVSGHTVPSTKYPAPDPPTHFSRTSKPSSSFSFWSSKSLPDLSPSADIYNTKTKEKRSSKDADPTSLQKEKKKFKLVAKKSKKDEKNKKDSKSR